MALKQQHEFDLLLGGGGAALESSSTSVDLLGLGAARRGRATRRVTMAGPGRRLRSGVAWHSTRELRRQETGVARRGRAVAAGERKGAARKGPGGGRAEPRENASVRTLCRGGSRVLLEK